MSLGHKVSVYGKTYFQFEFSPIDALPEYFKTPYENAFLTGFKRLINIKRSLSVTCIQIPGVVAEVLIFFLFSVMEIEKISLQSALILGLHG
jgi:hypothetical protein